MENAPIKVVSFDVDGTILRGRILDYLRVAAECHDKIEALHESYHQGKLGYEDTLHAQFSLLAGMNASEIVPNVNALPLISDLRTTIERLKVRGAKSVILTDNPSFIVNPLRTYGFQEVIASEIEIRNGVVTNRMHLLTNKLQAIRAHCLKEGIEITRCAHIGDGFNDVVAFRGVGLSVAFNSHEDEALRASTYRVNSNSMLDVYRVLEPFLAK